MVGGARRDTASDCHIESLGYEIQEVSWGVDAEEPTALRSARVTIFFFGSHRLVSLVKSPSFPPLFFLLFQLKELLNWPLNAHPGVATS